MPPLDVEDLSKAHDRDVYELRLSLSKLSHDLNAAHDAIRRVEVDAAKLKEALDGLHWYRDNFECVKTVVEQSTWVKQTRHVVVWVASGIAGEILIWDTLMPFFRGQK
jgi:hypothetical protein